MTLQKCVAMKKKSVGRITAELAATHAHLILLPKHQG